MEKGVQEGMESVNDNQSSAPPSEEEDRIAKAVELHDAGQYGDAESLYLEIIRGNPANARVWALLGLARYQQRAFSDAVVFFRHAVGLQPGNAVFVRNLALAFLGAGRLSDADEQFQIALRLDPNNSELRQEWARHKSTCFLAVPGGLQGIHAPQRQVYMSATVDLLKTIDRPLDILEVGSYAGASVITWARSLDRLHEQGGSILCVDPWEDNESLEKIDVQGVGTPADLIYDVFRHNASVCPERVRIDHIRATSGDALPRLRDASFDIIYVDGCHFYEETSADLVESHRLLRTGGILCGDDLEVQAAQSDVNWLRENKREDYLQDPVSGQPLHPGVTLAVHEFFGPVSAFSGFWAMRKTGAGYEPVSFAEATGLMPIHWDKPYKREVRRHFAKTNDLGAFVE